MDDAMKRKTIGTLAVLSPLTVLQILQYALLLITFQINQDVATAFVIKSTAQLPLVIQQPQLYSHPSDTNPAKICDNDNGNDDGTRRKFITKSILSFLLTTNIHPSPTRAAVTYDYSGDLTSQIYNEDGTLKVASVEAKSRTISVAFPVMTTLKQALTSIDGKTVTAPPPSPSPESTTDMKIEANYQVPDKWTPAPEYVDTSVGPDGKSVQKKACDRIVVYQVPGRFEDFNTLEKATTIGVTKALQAQTVEEAGIVFPDNLIKADVISGKKVNKADGGEGGDKDGKRKYFEFDLAVAPNKCSEKTAENLGLGFCPYDTIVLFSATIIEGKMMVCFVTCTREEWKRSSAEIKRVRESFFVALAANPPPAVDPPAAADPPAAVAT